MGTLTLKTKDGSLIGMRQIDPLYWIKAGGSFDTEFANQSLPKEAREKGTKVVSVTPNIKRTKNSIDVDVVCIVEWL